ncbi:MAG TPA: aminotransferase class III-fold pyridoxal phosphate-dependent enzyme [Thermoflexales bacterium]|nr:aminotransferase class III-fold pyridoxal phosphate-dependent enzyme [Thermoflexales bacterium]HQW35269.1 aminotransferase class III-fold pyridoxal phosphate-dependent enzyme [Thermoflexales bacterium]HQZ23051.1 aminotransferase class III-fold pyridoxal phosphate-dependent enzyme [Thermoflexales bacterium]
MSPTSEQIIHQDKNAVSPAIYRTAEIAIERGEGSTVWDYDGKRYYDLASGIATMAVGHSHPRVIKAVQEQATKLMHIGTPVAYTKQYAEMIEALRETMPAPLSNGKGVLMNSGGEAIEAAIKMARMVTGRQMILAFTGGFHGRGMGALAATGSNANYRRGLTSLMVGVQHVPYPSCHKCPFGHGSRATSECCGTWKQFIRTQLETLLPQDDLAGILVEPITGEGGYVVPPDDFLPFLRRICDRAGAMLIVDEVQTGLGRTGKWWGFEHSNVIPDIVAMGKAIGGGLPLGGIIAKAELADKWMPGSHGSTFGGNPMSCAAGMETVKIIRDENLLENAQTVGAQIRAQLMAAREHIPMLGDVRGRGMMSAVDLVGKTDGPLTAKEFKQVLHDLNDAGIILTKCGASTLRFIPALNISAGQAKEAMDIVLNTLSAK